MLETWQMYLKLSIHVAATTHTACSSVPVSSLHTAGARPPWVLWLAPRWRHLSGRWEVNRKPLSICMRTMEEATSTCCAKGPIFCSAKRISVNPFAAQLGSRWMRI